MLYFENWVIAYNYLVSVKFLFCSLCLALSKNSALRKFNSNIFCIDFKYPHAIPFAMLWLSYYGIQKWHNIRSYKDEWKLVSSLTKKKKRLEHTCTETMGFPLFPYWSSFAFLPTSAWSLSYQGHPSSTSAQVCCHWVNLVRPWISLQAL